MEEDEKRLPEDFRVLRSVLGSRMAYKVSAHHLTVTLWEAGYRESPDLLKRLDTATKLLIKEHALHVQGGYYGAAEDAWKFHDKIQPNCEICAFYKAELAKGGK